MTTDTPSPPDADAKSGDDAQSRRDAWRYTVLRHEVRHGEVHYDMLLCLPSQPRLVTLQLPCPPEDIPPAGVQATRLPDHRRRYLDYEGPIPGDRGTVTQHATGTFSISERLCHRLGLQMSPAQGIRDASPADLQLQSSALTTALLITFGPDNTATVVPTTDPPRDPD